eukprot:3575704-Rhodomonas_salina.1
MMKHTKRRRNHCMHPKKVAAARKRRRMRKDLYRAHAFLFLEVDQVLLSTTVRSDNSGIMRTQDQASKELPRWGMLTGLCPKARHCLCARTGIELSHERVRKEKECAGGSKSGR